MMTVNEFDFTLSALTGHDRCLSKRITKCMSVSPQQIPAYSLTCFPNALSFITSDKPCHIPSTVLLEGCVLEIGFPRKDNPHFSEHER